MGTFVENVNSLATTLVPAIVADIHDIAADLTNVDAVATSIEGVNTTASNIASVNTTAGSITNVNIAAANISDVNTVSAHIANVDTTAGNIAEIGTVATNIVSVLTVADTDNLADIKRLADDLNAIDANALADVTIVADDLALGINSKVGKVAADIANVNLVASNITDVDTLVFNMDDINEVATTVVPNIAEILLADTNATTATTQAGIATAAANTAASMLDQFDDRYLGDKATPPTLDNDGNALLVGALYFDTVTNRMRVWDGALWSDALVLTAGSISTLYNKTIDDISNNIGADHVHYKVRNASGSVIAIGTVLAASGSQPGTDYIQVVPVTDPQTQIAIGIAHTTLENNGIGLALNTGVKDDTDTSAWTVGTILYPNTTGGFTSTKPTSGRYQACAYVLRQHSSSGTLLCEFTEPKLIASTTQAGYVQLNNTLTSTSSTQALTAAQGKVLQDGKQPLDATLTALAGVTTAADKIIYATASDTFTTTTLSSFGRSLIDDADAAAALTTLGAASSSHVHGDVSNTGTISTAAVTPASTDYLLLADASNSNKIQRGVAIGTSTTTYLRNDGTWATPPDTNTTYSLATASVLGLVKLGSDTVQTTAPNTVTTTASRSYAIQANASGQMVVNIPWTDTVYTLPASVVHDTEPSALHATDALRISGTTLSLYKGDGTFESVTTQDTIYTHPTTDGNLHVPATGTTSDGKVLTAGPTAGSFSWQTPASGVTDHTLLSNIGTNTHDQIDTALTRLANTSGTNTGDETTATIKTKLGITTLSGSNTGDQDLSGYALTTHNHTGTYEPANANIQAHIGSTSNPHGVTKTQIGLSSVDNTSDADKPISTATQTALNEKAGLVSPAFTGTPTAPTAAGSTNNTQIATTAHVKTAYASADGTIGGVVKARLNGTTLYLTTNGNNA